jgi:translation initiation factor 2B subunit (eIF-2B alpha/beta/delta family)
VVSECSNHSYTVSAIDVIISNSAPLLDISRCGIPLESLRRTLVQQVILIAANFVTLLARHQTVNQHYPITLSLSIQAGLQLSLMILMSSNMSRSPILSNEILIDGIRSLIDDHEHGARTLATNGLTTLLKIAKHELPPSHIPNEDWKAESYLYWLRVAACSLAEARPSMRTAIASTAVAALNEISERLNSSGGAHEYLRDAMVIAVDVLGRYITLRSHQSEMLRMHIRQFMNSMRPVAQEIQVLTLSCSGSVIDCLAEMSAVCSARRLKLNVNVLESRPKLEGLTLVQELRKKVESGAIHFAIAPDSHVYNIASYSHLVIIGADRVNPDGSVVNKMGSFAAMKFGNENEKAMTIVVFECDKIAFKPGVGRGPGEEEFENNAAEEVTQIWPKDFVVSDAKVRNTYFELVPRDFICCYLTDRGVLSIDDIKHISQEKRILEDKIFSREVTDDAKKLLNNISLCS